MEGIVSVRQVMDRLRADGDQRKDGTLWVHVIRAIRSGALAGAEKTGPGTGMWLIPADSVEEWLGHAG